MDLILTICKIILCTFPLFVNSVIAVKLLKRPWIHTVFNIGQIFRCMSIIISTPFFLSAVIDILEG